MLYIASCRPDIELGTHTGVNQFEFLGYVTKNYKDSGWTDIKPSSYYNCVGVFKANIIHDMLGFEKLDFSNLEGLMYCMIEIELNDNPNLYGFVYQDEKIQVKHVENISTKHNKNVFFYQGDERLEDLNIKDLNVKSIKFFDGSVNTN